MAMGNRVFMHLNQRILEKRVISAAESALNRQKFVSAIDVFVGMGWLQAAHVNDWKRENVPFLERAIQANLHKISFAMKTFAHWARGRGLKPSKTAYLMKARGEKKELRFCKSGNPYIEEAYHTHFISPELTERKQKTLKEKMSSPPELVAYIILKDSSCSVCGTVLSPGSFLYVETDKPFCMKCAGFEDLVYLPSGNALLTRRARRYSARQLVVVRFSRARKRYERQGLLIEEQAYRRAVSELECEGSAIEYLSEVSG